MTREQKLEAALREFLDVTEPASHIPIKDPDHWRAVQELGDRIGYGAMMASAQASWRELLKRDGLEGGEHSRGPCYSVLMRAREMALDALKS